MKIPDYDHTGAANAGKFRVLAAEMHRLLDALHEVVHGAGKIGDRTTNPDHNADAAKESMRWMQTINLVRVHLRPLLRTPDQRAEQIKDILPEGLVAQHALITKAFNDAQRSGGDYDYDGIDGSHAGIDDDRLVS